MPSDSQLATPPACESNRESTAIGMYATEMQSFQNQRLMGAAYTGGVGVNSMTGQISQPALATAFRQPPDRSKRSGCCFMVAAIVVMLFEYCGYTTILLLPLLIPEITRAGLAVGILFHIFFGFLLLSFAQAVGTEPGHVPPHWGFYVGEEAKRRRYCKICNVWKPDRTHHCSACGKCVLNMDHHCPWINNCVGFYNRKYFIQLLCYINICLFFVDAHGVFYLFERGFNMWPKVDPDNIVYHATDIFSYAVVCGMLCISFVLTFALIPFTRFHMALIMKNSTTIENMDPNNRDRGKYDLGTRRNVEQVLGPVASLWWCPANGPATRAVGDGVRWRRHYLRAIDEDDSPYS